MEFNDLQNLLWTALSRPGYGQTAEEILDACRLVAEMQAQADEVQLATVRSEIGISPQVWKRMIAVSQKELLWQHISHLPANFSSIYRLSLLDSDVLRTMLSDGTITQELSSRSIDSIKKQVRIQKMYKTNRRQVHLFVKEELDGETLRVLLREVNQIAQKYNACFDSEDLETIQKENLQRQYSIRRQLIESEIQTEISMVLTNRSMKSKYDAAKTSGLLMINSCIMVDFGEFTKILRKLSVNREAMMSDFGRLYCLKLCHEYWRTTSRSQRYNYKRRLVEIQKTYPVCAGYAKYALEKLVECNQESEIKVDIDVGDLLD